MSLISRGYFSAASVLVLSACAATQPQMTRGQWLEATTRYYPDKTVDDVLVNAEKVLKLADNDFQFQHSSNEMNAMRPWSVYMVIAGARGVDYWRIQAVPQDSGVTMTAYVTQQLGGMMTPVPTAGGDISIGTTPGTGSPVNGTITYAMFWDRLDYMLGQTDQWITCEDSHKAYIEAGRAWGVSAPLCDLVTMNDIHPDPVIQAQREKRKELQKESYVKPLKQG